MLGDTLHHHHGVRAGLGDPIHYPANSLDSWQDAIARSVIHGDGKDPPRYGILESCQANSLTKDRHETPQLSPTGALPLDMDGKAIGIFRA